MKIRLTVDGRSITATLINSPTTRDFLSLLPLTLTLEDYANTEKIAYLPRKLSEKDAPAGVDPSAGDITYYAPCGNIDSKTISAKSFLMRSRIVIYLAGLNMNETVGSRTSQSVSGPGSSTRTAGMQSASDITPLYMNGVNGISRTSPSVI